MWDDGETMTDTKKIYGGQRVDSLTLVTADQRTLIGSGSEARPLRVNSQAVTGIINVMDFGARGDGLVDDSGPILEATAFAAEKFNVTDPEDPARVVFGAGVYFPKGAYQTGRQLRQPNGVAYWGDGSPATRIFAAPGFNAPSLVCNADQTGGQEFVYLRGITVDGNQGNGAVCSSAVVDYVSVFVNSSISDALILNGSNVGLRLAARNAMGPVVVSNTWIQHCVGHNVLVEEEEGNTGGAFGIQFNGVWSENCGPGSSAIYLRGRGHSAQWNFWNVHIEQGTDAADRCGITIDGVPLTLIDGVQILRGSVPLSAGIRITNVETNIGIQIRNVSNPNLVDPIVEDLLNGVTVGAKNVKYYTSAGVEFRGGPRFTPSDADVGGSPGSGVSLVIQDASGVDRVWFDKNARLNGDSLFESALEIVSHPTTNQPLLFLDKTKDEVYGFYFEGNSLRLRCFTGDSDIFNFDSDGKVFVYEPITIQFLLQLQSAIRGPGDRTTPPVIESPTVGQVVFNANPIAGGFAGWIYVEGGVWKEYGVISP